MRNLDHFVMPVADLAVARARCAALGFTVAPDAIHPFGTQNCCVFFGDGTFIEPLAIGNGDNYSAALLAENSFVKDHSKYTAKHGPEGFSHLVVKSGHAKVDHAAFVDQGISAGDIVDFGRTFTKPDGTTGEVAFSLAFAKPSTRSLAAFFACEVVKALPGGRGALVDHANGVLSTKRVVLSADEPTAHVDFFHEFLGVDAQSIGHGVSFSTETGAVEIVSTAALFAEYGIGCPPKLSLQAVVLRVASFLLTRDLLAQNGIAVHDRENRIIVPPASGQGGIIVFEE